MEDVTANKRKMKELEDNLLYKLTSTQVTTSWASHKHTQEATFHSILSLVCFYLQMKILISSTHLKV